ncbi:hypothetical protein TASIC1_0007031500 [Trichoderma asperellum]|uniref:Uncharacterized protein n=1 Tax=Trichoderma asperellum TaxID=101201 RepID=A0A6V8R2K2_TRIAP|nr:hypothetical protein LI328DRAFT_142966 [Trichoderma asperelloides]GFP56823.1 hypothetical protein TASIC1_0007031500 [Trichoderma asperellum]
MTAQPSEPRDFISDLEDLEDLLCHHITNSEQSPELFTEQMVDILKNVLSNDRTTHWSTKSFMRDLREEYNLRKLTDKEPNLDRGSHESWPRINRTAIEPLSNMPLTHDRGTDPWSFAVRLADQLYNVLRLQAKMPYKPFIEVLTENGFNRAVDDDSAMYGSAADGNDDSDQIQDRQGYEVSLHARLSFLEDRVKILEKREELLEGQLDRATQAMAALRSTNLELAKKVSEVQQRNHDLTRSYVL